MRMGVTALSLSVCLLPCFLLTFANLIDAAARGPSDYGTRLMEEYLIIAGCVINRAVPS